MKYFAYSSRGGLRRGLRLSGLGCLGGLLFAACGHVGIDLDGTNGLSVDASDSASPHQTSKPPKPTPSESDDASVVGTGVPSIPSAGSSTIDPVTSADVGDGDAALDASTDADAAHSDGGDSAVADAALDAAHETDGATDADVVEPSDAADAAASDAGQAIDGGSHHCSSGETCSIHCIAAPCEVQCEPGSTCTVEVGDNVEARIDCALGAWCELVSPTALSTQLRCSGEGECHASCGNAIDCSLKCEGAGVCKLDCGTAEDCTVDCRDDRECYLLHPDAQTQPSLLCDGNGDQECTNSLLACNAQCL